jgi:AraC family transcriptional regulator
MALEPRIILKPAFSVVGLSCPLARLDGDPEALWQELGDRYAEIPQADPDAGYGVHTWTGSGRQYLAGLALRGGEGDLPTDMTVLQIGAHAYAVFVHTGLVQDLPETVARIYEGWLPGSIYESVGNFYLEYYDDRFTPGSPDSVVFLWAPVVAKK